MISIKSPGAKAPSASVPTPTGPPDSTDPTHGHDPSVITDFNGFVGQADLLMSGTGTDTTTGESAPYMFHTDMRFMMGEFVGTDGQNHRGAFAFI